MGKSFQGMLLEQTSEDSSWKWNSRLWERNEEIVQYNKDENKEDEFIGRREAAKRSKVKKWDSEEVRELKLLSKVLKIVF